MERTEHGTPAVVLPPRPRRAGAPELDDTLLLDAVAALAAADTPADAADAALRPLLRLAGVRAGAVARAARPGTDPVLLASRGYDCTTMAVGTRLPRDAGMPVTECVRTGQLQVVGTGPSWVAVPAGPATALLLSLTGPPPADADLARLARLGDALAGALQRALRSDDARTRLAVLETGLAVTPAPAEGLVVRSLPARQPLCGDVVEQVVDGAQRWVLVADVCGSGHTAAVSADRLRAAFTACAPGATGPADVLGRLDRALRCGEEDFATALVLQVRDGGLVLATAGHPAPLLVPGGRVALPPAAPLGLRLDGPWTPSAEVAVAVAAGTRVLLATDGLVDRGAEVDLDAVVGALPGGLDADALADAVLAGCEAAGPAQDDVTVAVLTL